ncbi:hypothetical protein [Peribacillus simplex]|nr:hypothetical protein [Peribacillus simplex]
MYHLQEGTNTYTTYWLESSNGTNVSPAVTGKDGYISNAGDLVLERNNED